MNKSISKRDTTVSKSTKSSPTTPKVAESRNSRNVSKLKSILFFIQT